jgi:hypothetical protein
MPGAVQRREPIPVGDRGAEEGQDLGAGGGGKIPAAGTPLRQQQICHGRYRSIAPPSIQAFEYNSPWICLKVEGLLNREK